MPRGTCCQMVKGSNIRPRRSSLLASWPLWKGSCVVCVRGGLRLWRGTTARGASAQQQQAGSGARVTVHGKTVLQSADAEEAGRRRESAVLIRQVTTWRLDRIGLKSLTAFHDLTNHLDRLSGRRWTGLWRPWWGRMLSSVSRDTDWRLPSAAQP